MRLLDPVGCLSRLWRALDMRPTSPITHGTTDGPVGHRLLGVETVKTQRALSIKVSPMFASRA
jgi:hypothetical protein